MLCVTVYVDAVLTICNCVTFPTEQNYQFYVTSNLDDDSLMLRQVVQSTYNTENAVNICPTRSMEAHRNGNTKK